MTPRPLISSSSRRPLSAIFLGPLSLPPKEDNNINIPDLPEPPESPGAASSSSGLPSPPATNSTGSGSTGDNKSATTGSLRQRSHASLIMSDRNYDTHSTPSKPPRTFDDDDDDENDNSNEEDTARLDRSHAMKSPNENLVALQRVKSLTERNRMVSALLCLLCAHIDWSRCVLFKLARVVYNCDLYVSNFIPFSDFSPCSHGYMLPDTLPLHLT